MDITTNFVLQSQATRLFGTVSNSRGRMDQLRGYYPLWLAVSTTNYTHRSAEDGPVDHNSRARRAEIFSLSFSRFTRRY